MAFTWDGRYALRRTNEDDPIFHRIYKHSANQADITDADNFFSTAPLPASKAKFDAISVVPPQFWRVSLKGQTESVEMGIYQLRGRT